MFNNDRQAMILLIFYLFFRTFGCKWTIALSFITYMPFILSQLYPKMYTMIPSGLAVGLGGGPMWCAKCTYLTVVAEALAIFNGKNGKSDALVVRFFGLFFIFYQLAQVWGNLISSSGWLTIMRFAMYFDFTQKICLFSLNSYSFVIW